MYIFHWIRNKRHKVHWKNGETGELWAPPLLLTKLSSATCWSKSFEWKVSRRSYSLERRDDQDYRRSWKIWTIWRSATHAISQHHYRDMHCTKWSRAHQSPSNLFSCSESGLKFAYFAIKFFQLFFTVQWWQSGIALRKNHWIYIVIKEKKNNLIEQPHVSYLTRLPLSHSWHPMSIVRPSLENVN